MIDIWRLVSRLGNVGLMSKPNPETFVLSLERELSLSQRWVLFFFVVEVDYVDLSMNLFEPCPVWIPLLLASIFRSTSSPCLCGYEVLSTLDMGILTNLFFIKDVSFRMGQKWWWISLSTHLWNSFIGGLGVTSCLTSLATNHLKASTITSLRGYQPDAHLRFFHPFISWPTSMDL